MRARATSDWKVKTNMGVIYSVACKTCRKWRDLDKLVTPGTVEDHYGALEYAATIRKRTYNPALLISFMVDHMGHDCTLINDGDSAFDDLLDGYEEDEGFWDKYDGND